MDKERSVLELTPRKNYHKNTDTITCRLCVQEASRKYGIFSKSGVEKQLAANIFICTGITILKTNNMLDVICRNCERFVDAMMQFRKKCFDNQLQVPKGCSIKRVISPPKNERIPTEKNLTSRKHLNFDSSSTITAPTSVNSLKVIFETSKPEIIAAEVFNNYPKILYSIKESIVKDEMQKQCNN